jgi:1-phosphofructokinase family hexose kinase
VAPWKTRSPESQPHNGIRHNISRTAADRPAVIECYPPDEESLLLVVTPNLCFDRTLRVERFTAGAVVRPYAVLVTAGGKGVNVCRALAALDRSPQLLGLVAEDDAATFRALADGEGLRLHAVPVAGRVRQATIILEDGGRASVLNEPGPLAGETEAEALTARAAELLGAGDVLACSGSLPPGMPDDLYGRLAAAARAQGSVAVVDGARAALREALAFEPDLVTPNLHEAEAVVSGRSDESSHDDGPLEEVRARAFAMATALRERGARRALVTAGAHGAAYVDAERQAWVESPTVAVANPIGAGDALVGGVVDALDRGQDWLDAARWGVCVASAAVEDPVAGHLDAARARALAGTAVAS